jgi:hypothetical protein
MYSFPVLLAFLCVTGLVCKFSNPSASSSIKGIKKIQNKLRTGGAYLDMDEEDDQHHAEGLKNLDFLGTSAGGTGTGTGSKKNILEDPFNFGHRGESKSYTPLFSPERKRSSITTQDSRGGGSSSPPSTPPTNLPQAAQAPPSSELFDFADFGDFVTVGFDT